MIQITEYWNKVIDDPSAPFKRKVSPDYEIHRQFTIEGDLNTLKKQWKNHPRITIENDKITEDKGKCYGIHSYIEIVSC
jgi:hypothetical protein